MSTMYVGGTAKYAQRYFRVCFVRLDFVECVGYFSLIG